MSLCNIALDMQILWGNEMAIDTVLEGDIDEVT